MVSFFKFCRWSTCLTSLHLLFSGFALATTASNAPATAAIKLDAGASEWLKQHPVVSYAPEKDYGPFVFIDAKGNPTGMSVDFLQLIGQKTGLQFRATEARSLSENLDLAKRKEVDVITSLRPNPERGQYLDFTSPYISIPAILVVSNKLPASTTLADMAGKRIAVGKGYAVESHVREHYKQVQWVALPSDGDALNQLLSGQVDGLVADVASIHFIAGQNGKAPIVLAGKVGFEYPLSFAYRKDMPQLGAILQSGLQAISLAEREKLVAQWLPKGSANDGQSHAGYVIALVLLAAAGGAVLLLRRKTPEK